MSTVATTKKEQPLEKESSVPPAVLSPTSVVQEGTTETMEPIFLTSSVASDWPTLVPSAKSERTKNPIRDIVDPIVASIQAASERKDKKELISLAVSGILSH